MDYIFNYKNSSTTNQMGFDTVEINLVWSYLFKVKFHHTRCLINEKWYETRPGSKVISLINFEPFMGLKIGLTLREGGG